MKDGLAKKPMLIWYIASVVPSACYHITCYKIVNHYTAHSKTNKIQIHQEFGKSAGQKNDWLKPFSSNNYEKLMEGKRGSLFLNRGNVNYFTSLKHVEDVIVLECPMYYNGGAFTFSRLMLKTSLFLLYPTYLSHRPNYETSVQPHTERALRLLLQPSDSHCNTWMTTVKMFGFYMPQKNLCSFQICWPNSRFR